MNNNIIYIFNIVAALFLIYLSYQEPILLTISIILIIINIYFILSKNQVENFSHHNMDIYIRSGMFSPERLYVKLGDTVNWKNIDKKPHIIRSKLFNSGLIYPGQAYQYTFNEFGDYNYWDDLCNLYGSIYVNKDDYLVSQNDFYP